MNAIHLRFYTYETRKHGDISVYEWLLESARKQGIQGGSAFRAMAGFGRHGTLHEQHFFELAGDVPVMVEFLASEDDARTFLAFLRGEKIDLFYSRHAVQCGHVREEA
jgi:PII-like signaling protein